MITIDLSKVKYGYDIPNKVFTLSEKDVPFDTSYQLLNPKTNGTCRFEFSHSTGPEFDPSTKWVYESNETDGITLEICNDPVMVEVAAEKYLKAKLRR